MALKPTLESLRVMVPFLASTASMLSGYDIMKRTNMGSGACYEILHRLERGGWLTSKAEMSNPNYGFPKRRLYAITQTGKAQAKAVLNLLHVST